MCLDNKIKAADYNYKFSHNDATLIRIHDIQERAFLSEYKEECSDYLEETFSLIE